MWRGRRRCEGAVGWFPRSVNDAVVALLSLERLAAFDEVSKGLEGDLGGA